MALVLGHTVRLQFPKIVKTYTDNFMLIVAGLGGWRAVDTLEFETTIKNIEMLQIDWVILESNVRPLEAVEFPYAKRIASIRERKDVHRALGSLAQLLVGHTCQILRDGGHLGNHPVHQFFRHVRNGCFHGNAFKFDPGQPNKPAAWHQLMLDAATHQGRRVFKETKGDRNALLDYGDALFLLRDVCDVAGLK